MEKQNPQNCNPKSTLYKIRSIVTLRTNTEPLTGDRGFTFFETGAEGVTDIHCVFLYEYPFDMTLASLAGVVRCTIRS